MSVSPFPRKAVLARLSLAESSRQTHFYVAIGGDKLEDMVRPGYFDSLAPRLRRYDKIEVVSDDDSFYAEFLVLESSSLSVRVLPWKGGEFADVVAAAGAPGAAPRREAELHVKHRGPFLKWCCMRGEQVLKDKLESEAQAVQWLNTHAQTTSSKGAA